MMRAPRLRQVLAMALLPVMGALVAPATAQATTPSQIIEREVSFTVQNVNRTDVACTGAPDGKTYTVRGTLTGNARELMHPSSVTLLLHGLSYGEFFGNYEAQAGYDFAQKQAAAGHTTVTIDRLGYDSSDRPLGTAICFGSRADIAHQIVDQLRSGGYTSQQHPSRFPKVVLAGHSVGALIAQTTAFTFRNVDGLMSLSYSDTDVSPAAMQALATATAACAAGGSLADGTSGPAGYVYFGADTPQQFLAAHFYAPGAEPIVADTTAALRNRDPCGDITSYLAAVKVNLDRVDEIRVPVLVMTGSEDAIYPVPASKQASLFTGTRDVTAVTVPATGHALVLHRSRHEVSGAIAHWLDSHGFAGAR